ncbi:MAG: hypothetical protein FJ030_06480 [Chloroflexi bacterium]|nr:hypothetical protein [Chloroflexota bacterium]
MPFRCSPLRGLLFLIALLCGSTFPALAQESDELTLAIHRDFGYGGGSQIQGLFTLEATGPSDLASVTFMIDDIVIGEATSPPFKLQFDTDKYPAGWHDLIAVGATAEGRRLTSQTRRFEFVSPDFVWKQMSSIFATVGGFVLALMLIGMAIQFAPSLLGKKRGAPFGAARNYGWLGGAICPKCKRPFAIHWWSFNAGFFRKFDRCDHCGKWSIVSRASREQLAAAEAAELAASQPEPPISELSLEEKLKRQLDDSRYIDE